AGERDLALDRAPLRDRPRLRHARQRGEGRALPPPLRRARPAARRRVPLRHRLVLPAQEEVDEGAALVRPRPLFLPDLPPLPLPPRLLPREGAPPARRGRGLEPRAPDLGGRAERAAPARPRRAGAGALPSFARAARSRRLRGLGRGARSVLRARP